MKLLILTFLIVLFVASCTPTTDSDTDIQKQNNSFSEEPLVGEVNETTEEQKQEKLKEIEEEIISTPNQVEGPYYPVSKPDDSDENLRLIGNSSELASGTPLEISGVLVDENQYLIEGGVIEIWQADEDGYYDHPEDPGYEERDSNFQSYGESITNEKGEYFFETILPGLYDDRPRHIHVKVRLDGEEVLTTQFYFVGDERLPKDLTYRGGGEDKEILVMQIAQRTNEDGTTTLVAEIDIKLGATNDPNSARNEYYNR